jgi:DNA-binding MurR/RpiR family transcriptional regulator
MESNMNSIMQIESHMKVFTKTEQRVAKYILNNPDAVIKFNIVELAELSQCSEATIIRFCKSLGYKGFQHFKIVFVKNTSNKNMNVNPEFDVNDSMDAIVNKSFLNLETALTNTKDMLNIAKMEEIVDAILKCKHLVIFGSGGSSIIGLDAQHKFLKIGIEACCYIDADMQLMGASLLNHGDVALGISNSGTNTGTIECLRIAQECKATTIVLTTQGKSPIMKYGDIVLQYNTQEMIFKSESGSGRIMQLALIDILINAISLKIYNKAYKAIQKTRNATAIRKI